MSKPFLSGYSALKLPIISPDGVPEWPELFPIQKIDELRETVGPRHFSAQMMLEFISEERARLDPGALHFYYGDFDSRSATIKKEFPITGAACYWDPSGGRAKADGSVVVLLYRDDASRRAFIHNVLYLDVRDEDAHPLATQCERVLGFMADNGQRIIYIETNGLGNALPEILREVAGKRGQGVVVRRVINHQRKETRILDAIEPMLTTGRLFANERVRGTPLLAEMLGWTPTGGAGHDDGLDALAGALRAAPIPIRALGQNLHSLRANTDFKI
ncbi:MAG: hypothetical protein LBJ18_02730 [Rickettsiales bacterium]|nr:hypothetical protein [Rickettsiales bacterium]